METERIKKCIKIGPALKACLEEGYVSQKDKDVCKGGYCPGSFTGGYAQVLLMKSSPRFHLIYVHVNCYKLQ